MHKIRPCQKLHVPNVLQYRPCAGVPLYNWHFQDFPDNYMAEQTSAAYLPEEDGSMYIHFLFLLYLWMIWLQYIRRQITH